MLITETETCVFFFQAKKRHFSCNLLQFQESPARSHELIWFGYRSMSWRDPHDENGLHSGSWPIPISSHYPKSCPIFFSWTPHVGWENPLFTLRAPCGNSSSVPDEAFTTTRESEWHPKRMQARITWQCLTGKNVFFLTGKNTHTHRRVKCSRWNFWNYNPSSLAVIFSTFCLPWCRFPSSNVLLTAWVSEFFGMTSKWSPQAYGVPSGRSTKICRTDGLSAVVCKHSSCQRMAILTASGIIPMYIYV